MEKFVLELTDNKIKVYSKNENKLITYKIRGEEINLIESFDDILEIKRFIKRENEEDNLKFDIIYSKNTSNSFLNSVYLTFLLNKKIEDSYFDKNVRIQGIEKENTLEINQISGLHFDSKVMPQKVEIKKEENEFKEKFENMEAENRKLKSEMKKLKVQTAKDELQIERNKILERLKKLDK